MYLTTSERTEVLLETIRDCERLVSRGQLQPQAAYNVILEQAKHHPNFVVPQEDKPAQEIKVTPRLPTVSELEKILAEPDAKVYVDPDGNCSAEVTTSPVTSEPQPITFSTSNLLKDEEIPF